MTDRWGQRSHNHTFRPRPPRLSIHTFTLLLIIIILSHSATAVSHAAMPVYSFISTSLICILWFLLDSLRVPGRSCRPPWSADQSELRRQRSPLRSPLPSQRTKSNTNRHVYICSHLFTPVTSIYTHPLSSVTSDLVIFPEHSHDVIIEAGLKHRPQQVHGHLRISVAAHRYTHVNQLINLSPVNQTLINQLTWQSCVSVVLFFESVDVWSSGSTASKHSCWSPVTGHYHLAVTDLISFYRNKLYWYSTKTEQSHVTLSIILINS